MPSDRLVTYKYLGHATFLFTTPAGQKLRIDPWLKNNPACPQADKDIAALDTMLITHGHFDHIQDAVELAKRHRPQIGCIFETAVWLQRKGVENVSPMNKGGSQKLRDVRVTLVDARHSCGILEDDGSVIYGGEAAGYVVEFENGFRIYHAGDTTVFGDMKIIAEILEWFPCCCIARRDATEKGHPERSACPERSRREGCALLPDPELDEQILRADEQQAALKMTA